MTSLEKHYQAVAALGCLPCKLMGMGWTPAELHHPWGRKGDNEYMVIPCCFSHHRAGIKNELFVSRHPFKREWEKRYGKEEDLYNEVMRRINVD